MLKFLKMSLLWGSLLFLSQCSLFFPSEETSKDILVVYDTYVNSTGRYDHDIWVTDFDGNGNRSVLVESSNEFSPRFNVEGSGIYYLSDSNGARDLFFADTAGDNQIALTAGIWIESYDVSPAGNRLAFTHYEAGISNVYLVNSDGTNQNFLCGGRDPVFTDNGDALILMNPLNSQNLRKVTIGSTDTLEITTSASGTAIIAIAHERERFIVWTKPDNLTSYSYYFMNHNGAFLNSLSFGSGISGQPALSSDGLQIAYSTYSTATSGVEVYAGNSALSTPKQLTKQGLYAQNSQFFPDDDYLIYTQQSGTEYSLYHVDAKGRDETQISHIMSHAPLSYDVFVY